jgi:hypothetical protein
MNHEAAGPPRLSHPFHFSNEAAGVPTGARASGGRGAGPRARPVLAGGYFFE